ncbi:MAG: two component transcriptional regulator, LuxR family [Frankiales bacterium]|nr:two component transcriptional regulator, LuxR family [Frankiales bacterium]
MIRILLVDDHPVVRRGLTDLLNGVDGLEVVAAVDDGARAVAAVLEHAPDVVLMDLSMPEVDGTTATRRVLAAAPATRVVVLTSFAEAEQVTGALEAGAVGYLLKDSEPDVLVRAVQDAAAGGAPLSARVATALLPSRRSGAAAAPSGLTDREREVLVLVAEGLPNKLIARRLDIAERTVKAHLTRVFTVLGVSDRTSAALWAQRNDLRG